jgi:serine carboxypeptidase 1
VGTGWSYVDDPSLLVRNNSAIAIDVVSLLKDFFTQYPLFQTTPFFIFSESYGGKMTVAIANALLDSIDAGEIKTNFRGASLGDSWISGVDSVSDVSVFE